MVWGANSVHETSRSHIVEGTMNAVKYIEVLKGQLLPQEQKWYGENPGIFHQDSAPCHTARAMKTWFAQNDIELLPWVEIHNT